jgi:hypothetical protein
MLCYIASIAPPASLHPSLCIAGSARELGANAGGGGRRVAAETHGVLLEFVRAIYSAKSVFLLLSRYG